MSILQSSPSRQHAVHDSGWLTSHSFDRMLLPIPLPSTLHQSSVPNCHCGISWSARNRHTSGWISSHSFDCVLLPIPLPLTLHQGSVHYSPRGVIWSARNRHTSSWIYSHSFDCMLLPIPLPLTLHKGSVPTVIVLYLDQLGIGISAVGSLLIISIACFYQFLCPWHFFRVQCRTVIAVYLVSRFSCSCLCTAPVGMLGSEVLLVLRMINGVDAVILGPSLLGQRPALDPQWPLMHSINWDTGMDDPDQRSVPPLESNPKMLSWSADVHSPLPSTGCTNNDGQLSFTPHVVARPHQGHRCPTFTFSLPVVHSASADTRRRASGESKRAINLWLDNRARLSIYKLSKKYWVRSFLPVTLTLCIHIGPELTNKGQRAIVTMSCLPCQSQTPPLSSN